jgi:hypothetical protein
MLLIDFSDTCCNNRKLLEEIFGVPIKLDVFHSIQRIIRQLKSGDLLNGPNGRGQRTKFIREVRLIVRQRHDQGDDRKCDTASAKDIQANISELLLRWSGQLKPEIVKELVTLRDKHSVCMSQIPIGVGTHRNEQLHSRINAFQHDIKILSLQMEVAMIETLMYRRNQTIKSDINLSTLIEMQSKIIQNPPSLEFQQGFGLLPRDILVAVPSLQEGHFSASDVVYVKTLVSVMEAIAPESLKFKAVEILCCCPFIVKDSALGCKPNEEQHIKSLILDLGMEAVHESGEWSNAFVEAMKSCSLTGDNELFEEHVNLVASRSWLALVEEEMVQNLNVYSAFFSDSKEITSFQKTSHMNTAFKGRLAECTLQLYSNIYKSVIIVLTCSNSPIQTVFPTSDLLNKRALVVACLDSKGTVMSIQGKKKENPKKKDISPPVTCTCGKGRASITSVSCASGRCPCFMNKTSCTSCKCVNCNNMFGKRFNKFLKKTKTCRCGEKKTDAPGEFCITSRCECKKNGWSCLSEPMCYCKGCKNELGSSRNEQVKQKRAVSERDQMGSTGKKARVSTMALMTENNIKCVPSIWTDQETTLLFFCLQKVKATRNRTETKMIHELYSSLRGEMDGTVRGKSLSQVTYKLLFFKKYCNIYKNVL